MSIVGKGFLETAEKIIAQHDDEASLRTAASRAYYGALHEADSVVPDAFSPSPDERRGKSSHMVVIDAIVKWSNSLASGNVDAKQMARQLAALKRVRKDADYVLAMDFSREMAEQAIARAKSVVENANNARRLTSL